MQGTRTSVSELEVSNGRKEGRKLYLMTHSTHFIYGYMAETRNSAMGSIDQG